MKYNLVDVDLQTWKGMIREVYPTAKFYAAPEEEGGTREAYVGNKFVGDWDGSDGMPGRILKSA